MLDANLLDELALAPASALPAVLRAIDPTTPTSVGVIIEYEMYRRNNRNELPPLTEHSASPIVDLIVRLLDGAADLRPSYSLQSIQADAVNIPPALGSDPAWTAFLKRAEVTAREVGFANLVAAGLAGAIAELADNVIQHSDASSTGIGAFSRSNDRFEYVVADSGIGMLASLRKAPEFQSLRDDIEALPLAITPGVSRHGRGIGFGYGYRAVFIPLRAASGSIRLRSGQAVLHVSGTGPRPDQGLCSQRPYHQGVVVSVEISPTASGGG